MALDFDALAQHRTIDLTTIGRRSGERQTIEIWWFRVEDRFVITGTPGRRDWMANVRSDPRVVIEVAGHVLEATVVQVTDAEFRRRVFTDSQTSWYSSQSELDRLVATAPMVEVIFEGDGPS